MPTLHPSHGEQFHHLLDTRQLALVDIRCAAPDPAGQPVTARIGRPTLGFVRYGLGVLSTGHGSVRATPADVVLFNPGVTYNVHHVGCEKRRCAICLDIAPHVITEWLSEHGVDRPAHAPFERPVSRVLRSPQTSLLFYRTLAALRDQAGIPSTEELEELLMLLVASVLETAHTQPVAGRASAAVVHEVKEILAVRYREPLTLGELAAISGRSKYHLCRTFSAQTGLTISGFRHRLRINQAMTRILEGDRGLTELGQELGFCSHSHFSTVFRRMTGMTPSAFRRHVRSH